MKILMINIVCGIRSTGRICTDLAQELEKRGHEIKIAYGRGNVPEQFKKYAVKIGNNVDVNLHALKARLFDSVGFESRQVTMKFVKWIDEYNPDIIHLHGIHGYYINVEILFDYLKICNKRIIWTLHDCWAFTGHTAYCDTINCEKWKEGCFDCSLKSKYPKTIFDNSKRNWNKKKKLFCEVPNLTIITPSLWLKSMVEKSFLSKYVIHVINNGINTKLFRPVNSNFRHQYGLMNKRLLLSVATSWDDMKGLTDYKRLSTMLDDKYVIVLVGLSKKQIAKLPDGILGIEKTDSIERLVEIYTAVDVFVNLTYCDTYPTVNIEALLCGIPVITYKTGGSPEIVGDNGYIVEKGNLEKIKNAIEEICNNKKTNFELNTDMYDLKRFVDQYLELYSCG